MKTILMSLTLILTAFLTNANAEDPEGLKVEYRVVSNYNPYRYEPVPNKLQHYLTLDQGSEDLLNKHPENQLQIEKPSNARIVAAGRDFLEFKATARVTWKNPAGSHKYFEVHYTGRAPISVFKSASGGIKIDHPMSGEISDEILANVKQAFPMSENMFPSSAGIDKIEVYFTPNSQKISAKITASWTEAGNSSPTDQDFYTEQGTLSYEFQSAAEYGRVIGKLLMKQSIPHEENYGIGPACSFLSRGRK